MTDSRTLARQFVSERLAESRSQQLGPTVRALLQENENVKRTTEANLRELTEVRTARLAVLFPSLLFPSSFSIFVRLLAR